jgi:hypothetical protein
MFLPIELAAQAWVCRWICHQVCHSGVVQPVVDFLQRFASHGLQLQGGATPCSSTAATDAIRAELHLL